MTTELLQQSTHIEHLNDSVDSLNRGVMLDESEKATEPVYVESVHSLFTII